MSSGPTHYLFTVTTKATTDANPPVIVTCTCGAIGELGGVWAAIEWFGTHCFNAALDRAVQILKS